MATGGSLDVERLVQCHFNTFLRRTGDVQEKKIGRNNELLINVERLIWIKNNIGNLFKQAIFIVKVFIVIYSEHFYKINLRYRKINKINKRNDNIP